GSDDMSTAADSDSVLHSAGEGVGGFLAGIQPAMGDFFSGVVEGAGVHGMLDRIALIIGIALLVLTIQGLRRGRIVGPMLRGVIAVAFRGWAVT
ncbi:MAG: hypothetical protein ACI87W_002412, partial [Halieaceae bacterium]